MILLSSIWTRPAFVSRDKIFSQMIIGNTYESTMNHSLKKLGATCLSFLNTSQSFYFALRNFYSMEEVLSKTSSVAMSNQVHSFLPNVFLFFFYSWTIRIHVRTWLGAHLFFCSKLLKTVFFFEGCDKMSRVAF